MRGVRLKVKSAYSDIDKLYEWKIFITAVAIAIKTYNLTIRLHSHGFLYLISYELFA